jgi:hypothetical protein
VGRKDNWSLDQAIRWKNTSRKSYRKWIADSLAYRKWIGKSPQSVSSRSETIGLAPPYQKIYIKGHRGVGVGVRAGGWFEVGSVLGLGPVGVGVGAGFGVRVASLLSLRGSYYHCWHPSDLTCQSIISWSQPTSRDEITSALAPVR